MAKLLRAGLVASVVAGLLTPAPRAISAVGPADTDAEYAVCGRVFSDPHAYWPSPTQTAGRSPFAKGNAPCAATDFLSYGDMVSGMTYLEGLFPDFIEFYNLEEDFGGNNGPCVATTNPQDYCSAGLPQQGVPATREKAELYMIRVTDERVPPADKRFFAFPLSIHGIERAGAEAGTRAAEDLATWAYCEARTTGYLDNLQTKCGQEGAVPHPLLETQPVGAENIGAGEALRRSAIYFIFANPDGWRRGDPDNIARFYQRYNGNGVDMNRDWPTVGYTFRPYTPWSEPETRSFGKVLKGLTPGERPWDGGIDLHGQLVDRAFSFTLLGASERDYAKDQRILQTVEGAYQDAEQRLSWSPAIKPNDASEDDPRVYGVQWGTVWDTIDYTVTGSLGDWIDSPLGLGADGIDNEMSLSHLSNCGTGACYLPDPEQLHVDGNKSLVYSSVNFTLLPEDTSFEAPGKIGYVFNPDRVSDPGSPTPTPPPNLPTQPPIQNVSLDATNSFRYQFVIQGPNDGFYNGGVEGTATPQGNLQGVGGSSLTSLVLERYRPAEPPVVSDNTGCGADNDNWEEVNRYYNQSSIYLQSGQAVHANSPLPGRWRICLTGGLATQLAANGASVDLDILFSGEKAWEDPGQVAYDVSNMELFESLSQFVAPGQFVPVNADDVLSGAVDLDTFRSLVVADNALPGFTEPIPTGPAQPGQTHTNPGLGTAPCAYQRGDTDVPPGSNNPPATCYRSFEFDVDPNFNNQQLIAELTSNNPEANDWDLFVDRRSRAGDWFESGRSTTPTGNEKVTLLSPPPGHYRALVVNWSAADVSSAQTLDISFSNEYAGPPVPPSDRTTAERDAWGQKLKSFVARGGNLVLTDGAVRNLAYMGLLPSTTISNFSVYAGFIGFTKDGETCTFDDPLAADVKRPGAAEGPQCRHQTYEPVPIGYAIQDDSGADFNASPAWGIDQDAWEAAGGRTVGITTADQVSLGELAHGAGQVRVIGALAPMPTERYYHPFGLANYALTYTGYQVLKNTLQWERPATDLSVAKSDSPDPVNAGQELTYTLTVRNNGSQPATAVKLVDTLPPSASFVSSSASQGSCSGTSTVTCSLGTIVAGGTATVTIKVRPQTAGTIVNSATVSADNPDPNAGNNSASATTTVRAAADLSVDKTGPATAQRGHDMTYTIVVTNNGPNTATGVTLTDNLPKNAGYGAFTTTQGSCTLKPAKRLLTCNLGTVNNGGTATITIKVKPTSHGTISNKASVTATSPSDPNSANNSDMVTTTVT